MSLVECDISQEVSSLPFFETLSGSARFFYFCQVYRFRQGGRVLALSESQNGTVSQFVYSTGYIGVPDPMKRPGFNEELNANRIGVSPESREWNEALGRVQKDYRLNQLEFSTYLTELTPLVNQRTTVTKKRLEVALELLKQVEDLGELDAIAKTVERYVGFDGSQFTDIQSLRNLKGLRPIWAFAISILENSDSLPNEGVKCSFWKKTWELFSRKSKRS